MVSDAWALYGVVAGSTVIDQLSADLNTQASSETYGTGANPFPTFTAIGREMPAVPFQTQQIKTILELLGVAGADPGIVKLLYRRMANQGSFVDLTGAGVNHAQFTANRVLGVLQSISVGANRTASASVLFKLLTDGTNEAAIYSGSATITNAQSGQEGFVLGPVSHNGTELDSIGEAEIAFNPELFEPEEHVGHQPDFASVQMTRPVISFTSRDTGLWSLHRTAATNLRVNLVRKKPDLERYANGESQHVVLTLATGRIVCDSVAGDQAAVRVSVHGRSSNGTAAPIAAVVDSAVNVS